MNFKIKYVAAILSVTIISSTSGLFQAAQAEDSWSLILKPLVSSVVMPMVNKGIDTMKGKIAQKKARQATAAMFVEVQVETLSDAESSGSEMNWKLPEEPVH